MPGPAKPPIPSVEVTSRAELRAWLAGNHDQSGSVWLVTFQKSHPDYLDYGDLIEELICWGWVDSQSRGVDTERTSVRISPRNPNSAWSAPNKAKVAAARASGAMTPAGEALVSAAKANGMWTFLDDVERLEKPRDLDRALDALATQDGWEAYPRSVKRASLEWIKTAKTEATRQRRIETVATAAAEGQRPKPFR